MLENKNDPPEDITYDSDGDSLEVLWDRSSFYGEFRNDWLTLYRSQETNKIVGLCISDVSRLVK